MRLDKRFIGSWRILSWENRDDTGAVSHPLGQAPHGLLHYAADGYMFVHIMRGDRAALSSDALFAASEVERAAAFASHVAYAGRWEIRDGQMIHRLEVASVPNWVGGEQRRDFAFLDGDRLQLSASMEFDGRTVLARVTWQRL